MKTNYTTTLSFNFIKPKGKKASREQRKAWKLLHGTTKVSKVFQIKYYQEGHFLVATGTIGQLRPILKTLGKYRLPCDSPLIRNGKKAR